jgi:hypothetical protein
MLCVPTVKVLTVREPFPLPSRVAEPIAVPPSLKFTVPVGVPEPPPAADTVAVKVICCPNALGFGAALKVVVDEFLFTVWVRTGDDADVSLVSPGYCAVSE